MRKWIVGLTAGAAVSAVAGYELAWKPWRRQWDATDEEAARTLPGDDLIADPEFLQTMAVTVDAPPAAIWPWLLQMGYGRGGWYSYDAIDMLGHSSREIRPELQDLKVGDVVPFAPGIGFRVEVVEPERALVLYGDDTLIAQQEHEAARRAEGERDEHPGMKLAGALSDANMRAFSVSWAFVLEPLADGRTRLLERFRTRSTPGPATAFVRPLVDQGHFLMTRKQLLGIRERAEAVARTESVPATAEPAAVGAA
jgi:hypothetical protein